MNAMHPTTRSVGIALLSAAVSMTLLPAVGLAQETDHSAHAPKPQHTQEDAKQEQPAATNGHERHGAIQAPQPEPASEIDHAAMGHDVTPSQQQPAPPADPSGMDHSAMGHDGMPMAPAEPRTPIPEITQADRAAAVPPANDHPVHDNSVQNFVLLDRLEGWNADPGAGLQWEAQGWIGTDLHKLWLRSEGERLDDSTEAADLEVFYGRSIARWWDVMAGIRHDFQPGASQDFVAIGVTGLAPYKFEVEATAYIGESGQTAARLELEYETLLTNRLILQPQVEFNLYGKRDERRGIGAGLSTAEAGLRLRYEITRQFAPYIGVVHERAFGSTADFRRDEGEAVEDTRLVVGLRLWF